MIVAAIEVCQFCVIIDEAFVPEQAAQDDQIGLEFPRRRHHLLHMRDHDLW